MDVLQKSYILKVFNTPEVARVYIGSFWDKPLRYEMNERLFHAEEQAGAYILIKFRHLEYTYIHSFS